MTQPERVKRLPTCGVSPEVYDALDRLSALSGLSKAYLIKSVIEQHLVDLGLLATPTAEPTKPRGRKQQ